MIFLFSYGALYPTGLFFYAEVGVILVDALPSGVSISLVVSDEEREDLF